MSGDPRGPQPHAAESIGAGYRYFEGSGWDDGYLWAGIAPLIAKLKPRRIFDLGCGNGVNARRLAALGYAVTAVDPSVSGIEQAQRVPSAAEFAVASAYDDLAARFGCFDLVVSLEVVEHVYSPKAFIERVRDLLQPGGTVILSTPYHGYLKNLAIALSGRFDAHVNPLWEGGHIKFWSVATLRALLTGAGLQMSAVHRVGRIAPLAKSMIVVATRAHR